MKIVINDLYPMPRNRSHMLTVSNKRPMNIKTPLCREFEKEVHKKLEKYGNEFNHFKDLGTGAEFISAIYTIYTPIGSLFTKEGKISAKAIDLDAHKVLQDCLFRELELDDKLIREVTYRSPVSPDDKWHFEIELNWKSIECLKNTVTLTQNSVIQMSDNSESFALL